MFGPIPAVRSSKQGYSKKPYDRSENEPLPSPAVTDSGRFQAEIEGGPAARHPKQKSRRPDTKRRHGHFAPKPSPSPRVVKRELLEKSFGKPAHSKPDDSQSTPSPSATYARFKQETDSVADVPPSKRRNRQHAFPPGVMVKPEPRDASLSQPKFPKFEDRPAVTAFMSEANQELVEELEVEMKTERRSVSLLPEDGVYASDDTSPRSSTSPAFNIRERRPNHDFPPPPTPSPDTLVLRPRSSYSQAFGVGPPEQLAQLDAETHASVAIRTADRQAKNRRPSAADFWEPKRGDRMLEADMPVRSSWAVMDLKRKREDGGVMLKEENEGVDHHRDPKRPRNGDYVPRVLNGAGNHPGLDKRDAQGGLVRPGLPVKYERNPARAAQAIMNPTTVRATDEYTEMSQFLEGGPLSGSLSLEWLPSKQLYEAAKVHQYNAARLNKGPDGRQLKSSKAPSCLAELLGRTEAMLHLVVAASLENAYLSKEGASDIPEAGSVEEIKVLVDAWLRQSSFLKENSQLKAGVGLIRLLYSMRCHQLLLAHQRRAGPMVGALDENANLKDCPDHIKKSYKFDDVPYEAVHSCNEAITYSKLCAAFWDQVDVSGTVLDPRYLQREFPATWENSTKWAVPMDDQRCSVWNPTRSALSVLSSDTRLARDAMSKDWAYPFPLHPHTPPIHILPFGKSLLFEIKQNARMTSSS